MLKTALYLLEKNLLGFTTSQLERLHNSDAQFGIMSAWRNEYSLNENKDRNTKLIEELGLYGLRYTLASGVWIDSKIHTIDFETSLLIYNISFDTIWMLSEMFEQQAFIFKPSNGPVGLYSLSDGNVVVMTELTVLQNAMRIPKKRKMIEEGLLKPEDVPPHTMHRDTEIRYDFDFDNPHPFSGSPVTWGEEKPSEDA